MDRTLRIGVYKAFRKIPGGFGFSLGERFNETIGVFRIPASAVQE